MFFWGCSSPNQQVVISPSRDWRLRDAIFPRLFVVLASRMSLGAIAFGVWATWAVRDRGWGWWRGWHENDCRCVGLLNMVGSYWTLILLEIVGRLDGRGLQTPATWDPCSHKIQGSYEPRVVEPTMAKNLNNLIDVSFLCLLLQMFFRGQAILVSIVSGTPSLMRSFRCWALPRWVFRCRWEAPPGWKT